MRDLARAGAEAGAAAGRLNGSAEQSSGKLRELRARAAEEALALRKATGERQELLQSLGALHEARARSSERLRELRAGLGEAASEAARGSESAHEAALRLLGLQLGLDEISAQLDEQQENIQDLRYHRGHGGNRSQERFWELESRAEAHGLEAATIAANVAATDGHVLAMLRFLEAVSGSCSLGLRAHAQELRELGPALRELRAEAAELRERSGILGARLELGVRNLWELAQEMRAVDARHRDMIGNVTLLRGQRRDRQRLLPGWGGRLGNSHPEVGGGGGKSPL